ncbi:MAG: integrase domain-containing protein [Gammaproteobacteria bacterium]|nr:integrase domain-containing protein [Gammaproteobacteria bacterium]
MRQLNYDLKRLLERHREGGFVTRRDRSYALAQAADTLEQLGFRRLRAAGLKRKHVDALVREWQRRGLSTGTLKNRMAHLRWWARHVGRPGVVDTNSGHGIGNRRYVTNRDKGRALDPDRLARVPDAHVRMSLRLQAAFGLRREEAIKFTPSYADRGGSVVLKAAWTKGGRAREIPIWNEGQRAVLEEARRLTGGGALIPGGRDYLAQRKVYEKQTQAAGLVRMHGLRHRYAQSRYENLTGWKAPAAGGPRRRSLSPARRRADNAARLAVSRELGHGRPDAASVYLGT